ncbi:MAG: cupin domain-containing protein [Bacteroidota bacterium]
MTIVDLATTKGRGYPAGRITKNLVNGSSPVALDYCSLGFVELDPNGGQVPWHNHVQEEVYIILDGEGQMCIGDECHRITGGQMVHIPSNAYHQLTNTGDVPMHMVYCYAPAGDVDHWKQELAGTLPKAGIDVPALPEGAWPQHTDPPA